MLCVLTDYGLLFPHGKAMEEPFADATLVIPGGAVHAVCIAYGRGATLRVRCGYCGSPGTMESIIVDQGDVYIVCRNESYRGATHSLTMLLHVSDLPGDPSSYVVMAMQLASLQQHGKLREAT